MEKVLNMSAAIIVDDNIWFSEDEFNGLFRWNVHTRETTFVGRFPNERDQLKLHVDICRVDELLVFVPYCGKNIQIYDMKAQKFSTISLPNQQLEEGIEKVYQCNGGYALDGNVYLFPVYQGDSIIKLNPYTPKIDILSIGGNTRNEVESVGLCSSCIYRNENVYAPRISENGILKIDTCSGTYNMILLENQKRRYQSICKVQYNNCIYMWTEDNELIEYDFDTFSVKNVYHLPGTKRIIIRWVNIDNMIYGLDCIEGSIVTFDVEKKVINVFEIKEKCTPREYDFPGKLGMDFFGILSDNQFLYILPEKYYDIVCIPLRPEISVDELEMYKIKLPCDFDYGKYIAKYINDTDIHSIIDEEMPLTLDVFIEYVRGRKRA